MIRTKTSNVDKTQTKEATKGNIPDTETFDDELEMNETVDFDLFDLEKSLETDITDNINTRNQENKDASSTLNTLSFHIPLDLFLITLSLLLLLIELSYEKVLRLEGKTKEMKRSFGYKARLRKWKMKKSNPTGRYCLARNAHFLPILTT